MIIFRQLRFDFPRPYKQDAEPPCTITPDGHWRALVICLPIPILIALLPGSLHPSSSAAAFIPDSSFVLRAPPSSSPLSRPSFTDSLHSSLFPEPLPSLPPYRHFDAYLFLADRPQSLLNSCTCAIFGRLAQIQSPPSFPRVDVCLGRHMCNADYARAPAAGKCFPIPPASTRRGRQRSTGKGNENENAVRGRVAAENESWRVYVRDYTRTIVPPSVFFHLHPAFRIRIADAEGGRAEDRKTGDEVRAPRTSRPLQRLLPPVAGGARRCCTWGYLVVPGVDVVGNDRRGATRTRKCAGHLLPSASSTTHRRGRGAVYQ
ncbi:hypothetical protein K438DRAFT_876926 [Mycena galopus ATCC 62051]|nr:hypothetical protein K438DRAFT_876926 [Mycena galopus ATCC 62051]